ncbi:hypothetical protein [Azospirillum sp.]|uniref:hypothetical protein n=1 Tax=Azospirillum sp. TaxID=34012 RepID=UPI002D304C32|nr:hypothetical protein [Azospirillum sp.]HYD66174.1 hypothetical protein [Azospirillum sp.]
MGSTLVVITPPDEPVPSVEEVKAHLRQDFDDDDADIESKIWGAITEFEDPELGFLGRSMLPRLVELRLDGFCGSEIALPGGPLLTDPDAEPVILYDDADGVEQTLVGTVYRIVDGENASKCRVLLKSGQSWPVVSGEEQCIRIRYWVGYPASDIRLNNFKSAVKLHVEMTFDGPTDEERARLKDTIYRLLQPYRVYR